tara:strand:+ start:111 stop:767 length:657 start_codon:yes stop_codon:yes gene_type:complete
MELPIKTDTIGLNHFDISKIISLYSPVLAYHNFNHIVDVLSSAKKIMEDCAIEHIIVDEKIVNIAILFHDAGYQENHKSLGFLTKESYSAFLAREFLKEKNFEATIIDQIQSAILATEKNGSFEKTESKVVRAADLYGLSSQYDTFLENAYKIKAEYDFLIGRNVDWEDWKLATIKLLSEFLSREIELTAFFSSNGGCSQFLKQANINLRRFSTQSNI